MVGVSVFTTVVDVVDLILQEYFTMPACEVLPDASNWTSSPGLGISGLHSNQAVRLEGVSAPPPGSPMESPPLPGPDPGGVGIWSSEHLIRVFSISSAGIPSPPKSSQTMSVLLCLTRSPQNLPSPNNVSTLTSLLKRKSRESGCMA